MSFLLRSLFLALAGGLAACHSATTSPMQVPAPAVAALHAFQAQPKFAADSFYVGAQPPELQPHLEAVLNQSAREFIAITQSAPTQERYRQAIAAGLGQLDADGLDTEDRERVAGQYQDLMDIVGLESSGGLLNSFVYGEGLGGLLSAEK